MTAAVDRAPLRFTVPLYPYDRWGGVEPLADAVAAADELGYSAVTFAEHLVVPKITGVPDLPDTWYDNPTLAAYLSARTQAIRFVFLVMIAPHRHPIFIARQLATLDQVSGGRAVAGFGAGWLEAEFDALGVPFAERGAITDEYLDVMHLLWTEESASFHGDYVRFDNVTLEPRCVQRPHVPLWIGGRGERVLRRVVRVGDGWAPTYPIALEEVSAGCRRLRRDLEDAGRDPEALAVAFKLTIGESDPAVETAVRGHSVGEAALSGSTDTEELLRQLDSFGDAGVTDVNLQFSWTDPGDWKRTVEGFAENVLRRLR